MPPAVVLHPVTVVAGEEEFLVARDVARVVAAARAEEPDADVRDLEPTEATADVLHDLLAPSLFGGRRVVIVRGAHLMGKDAGAILLAYAADALPEVCLVLTHNGGKSKGWLEQLQSRADNVITCPVVKSAGDRVEFVRNEIRRAGGTIDERALRTLIDAVGSDLRELASAASQLVVDTTGGVITEDVVFRYHRGRADASGFLVADRVIDGDTAGALELLRWGMSTGLAAVLVTSAVASSLRAIAAVAGAGRSSTAVLAKQLGMPPWKVEKTQRQARGWRPDALSVAVRAVADADAAVKGSVADPAYALEKMVMTVTAARSAPGR
ncbi:MAG: polymerase delta subunit [Frankiales bacterium]|nr:polymerase delta subunit [Frankiales bacterium]